MEVSNDDELFLRQQYASTAISCFDFEGVGELDAVGRYCRLVGREGGVGRYCR